MYLTSVNRIGSAISLNSRRDAAMPPKVEKCLHEHRPLSEPVRVLLIILGTLAGIGAEWVGRD